MSLWFLLKFYKDVKKKYGHACHQKGFGVFLVFWKLKLEMDLIKTDLYVAVCHLILCTYSQVPCSQGTMQNKFTAS